MFNAIGSIIIDDIVLPDGRTFMGMLGGGVTHAAMGMRVWTDQVRLISTIGNDFPEVQMAEIGEMFDLHGVLRRDWMTTRAWQLFEENGHRTEVFRTPLDRFLASSPLAEEIPPELLNAEGAYMQSGTAEEFYSWVERLRSSGCKFILWEPWELLAKPENLVIYQDMARLVDAVSPNLEEAQLLTGKEELREILHCLLEGASVVALRMGEQGSLVAQKNGLMYQVSTVPLPRIVDVTGAGNAYCGGFLMGLAMTGNLVEAARHAAVSASLALGQFGAVYPITGVHEQAMQRLKHVQITRIE